MTLPQPKTLLRPVHRLRPGDLIVHDDYTAEIMRGPYLARDLFGRRMLGFWLRIVEEPDRVGDEGEYQFGEAGQATVRVSTR